MNNLNLPRHELEKLKSILEEKTLTVWKGKDKLVWVEEKIGEYNAKDGYKYLI